MTTTTISSGQTVSSAAIGSNTEIVLSGGFTVDPKVTWGGDLELQGGTATSASIIGLGGGSIFGASTPYARIDIGAGGHANDTDLEGLGVVSSGGVFSGGTVSGEGYITETVDDDSAELQVLAGGTAEKVTVGQSGLIGGPEIGPGIDVNGFASGIQVQEGGWLNLESGGLSISSTVVGDTDTYSGQVYSVSATEYIYAGGTTSAVTVGLYGSLIVNNGGTAKGVVIAGTGADAEIDGGTIASASVAGGGRLDLTLGTQNSGGTVSNVTVSSGGVFAEFAAADSGTDIHVLSGGVFIYYAGKFSNVTIDAGGHLIVGDVLSGKTVSGQTMVSGYTQTVHGTTVGEILLSGASQDVNGLAKGTIVQAGASQTVTANGYAEGTIVSSGGFQDITSNQFTYVAGQGASGTTILAGGEQIVDTGTVLDTVVRGTQIVNGYQVTISGKQIYYGGSVSGVTVANAGQVEVNGGLAANVSVVSGGHVIVDGGTVTGLSVASGGTVVVSSGAVTTSSGSVYGVHVLSGGEAIFGGGTMPGLIVDSGGAEGIASGATISSVVNGAGVTIFVSKGGTLVAGSGTVDSNVDVLSGGTLVYEGGGVKGITLASGSRRAIATGVKVASLTIGSGTQLLVSSGGTAASTILNGGTEIASIGANITGTTNFSKPSELAIHTASGADVAFTAAKFQAGSVIDLANFAFGPSETLSFVELDTSAYTLTVTDGAVQAQITLLGQYTAAGFHLATDHGAGTDLTYSAPTTSGVHADLAGQRT